MPWLIEHNIQFMNAPMWVRCVVTDPHAGRPNAMLEFHKDASVAMQFGRKADAYAFIYLHREFCVNCRATEHEFIGRA